MEIATLDLRIDLTWSGIAVHGWQVVLLKGKVPDCGRGQPWPVTTDHDVIARHLRHQGNLGLVCGGVSGVDVLDFDDLDAADALFAELGPLVRHVQTGSGKCHCYVQHEDGLPAKIYFENQIVGEVQRGPAQQQVVLPPSIHPGNAKKGIPPGGVYQWLVDPVEPLPILPVVWRAYLLENAGPEFAPADAIQGPWDGPWDGPSPEELLARALEQPGARRRSSGVKFQCPGCSAEGHDEHQDNARVGLDGRSGCALNPEHRRAIGEALGVNPSLTTLGELNGLQGLGMLRGL